MTHNMFEPLSDTEVTEPVATATSPNEDWRPTVPAPQDKLPPDSPKHATFGRPSRIWKYRDAAGAVLFVACRFEKVDGCKAILPLTYGRLAGRDGWHWKHLPPPRPLYALDRLAM